MPFTQMQFMGLSVRGAKTGLGWGTDQFSTLTVELVYDPTNGDSPAFPAIGTPVYFQYGNLVFNGLFQKFAEKGDISGYPVYEVICVDPRAILAGTQLIIGAYNGTPIIPNVQNVFGYMENNLGFGGAGVNESGMLWSNILFALNAMVNGLDVSAYGGPLVWNGVSYSLDLSQLPITPNFYRIGGTTVGLLDAIAQVCQDGACDFFVDMVGFTIRVRTVSRLNQPPLGTISALTTADTGIDLVRYERGVEARSDNVPNSVLLLGGDVTNLHLSANLLSFWGYDIDGNPITGSPTTVSLKDNKGKVTKSVSCEAMNLNAEGVEDVIGATSYSCTTLELRLAMDSYDSWSAYIQNYRKDISNYIYSPLGAQGNAGGMAVKPNLVNDARAAALQLAQSALNSDFHIKQQRLYEFVRRAGEDFYGKQFLVGIPFVAAHEDDETFVISYSLQPIDAAWYSEDLPPLSLPDLKADILRVEDGRYRCFVEYDINPNKQDNLSLDFSTVPAADSVTGDNTLYLLANLSGGIVVVNGSPYVLVSLSGAIYEKAVDFTGDFTITAGVVQADQNQFKQFSQKMAQGNIGVKAHPAARYPVAAALPLKSNTSTYGPWYATGAQGPAAVEHDQTLVPWNYGGEAAMELAASQRVLNAFSNQTLTETGTVELVGAPLYSLGDIMQANGPNLTNVEFSYGPQGVVTTYRMATFTPRFGVFSKFTGERLRRLGLVNQQLKRAMRQVINQDIERSETISKATTARQGFMANAPKAIKRQSPHETLLSYSFMEPSGDVRVGVSTASYEEALAGVAETIIASGVNDGDYLASAAMSVAGLVRPYATVKGSGTMMPALTSPTGNLAGTTLLNSTTLNPLASGNDIEVYTWGPTYQGLHAYRRGASQDARGMALKGPLVVEGFGFDIYGKPVPGDGSGNFLSNYLRRSDQWPVGPVDPLWDSARGVWSVHDIVQGNLSAGIAPGGTGTLNVYNGNSPTSINLPIVNYGGGTMGPGIVGGAYLPHSNNWMTFPLEAGSSSPTPYFGYGDLSGSTFLAFPPSVIPGNWVTLTFVDNPVTGPLSTLGLVMVHVNFLCSLNTSSISSNSYIQFRLYDPVSTNVYSTGYSSGAQVASTFTRVAGTVFGIIDYTGSNGLQIQAMCVDTNATNSAVIAAHMTWSTFSP